MKRLLLIIVSLLCLSCQMDKKFAQLQTGMTRSQVVGILGNPDGAKMEDGKETLRYSAGSHFVRLQNGRVTEYGSD